MDWSLEREQELLAATQTGGRVERQAAFDAIYAAFSQSLFKFCLHLTGRSADAEDALQETMVGVYQGLHRFRGEARVKTWIYRIAVRQCARVRAKRPSVDATSAAEPSHDPRHRVVLSQTLSAALQQLSLEHRTVITLFALKGLSHEENAEILSIPKGTVWSRLHTARKKLKAAMST